MRPILLSLAISVLLSINSAPAEAQLRTQTVVSGLAELVAFVPDPANSGVFYAVQQSGVIRTVQHGTLLPTPFLDGRAVITAGGEQGLLGMAFTPDASRVFVNFTNLNGDTVIARFRRSPANPLVADPESRFDLRWPDGNRFINQIFGNHNGGHLAFGPDGYLYIGLGDSGSGNDPLNNAQNPNTLLGKMLRIDVNVPDNHIDGYRVPPDNPFLDGVPIAALGEIWDFGLRNPWRYSFDDPARGGTGALFIGDVGQGAREEIDYAPAGSGARNYGWRMREGFIATSGIPETTPAFTPLTDPLLDYGRSTGTVVTGGYVYRGTSLGANYFGRYFYADYQTARLWSISWRPDPSTGRATVINTIEHSSEIGTILGGISSFSVDLSGELYLVIYGTETTGRVLKLVVDAPAPAAPTNLTVQATGRTVALAWTGVAGATDYRIEAGSSAGASDLIVFNTRSLQTSYVAFETPDGVYHVRVRALNGSTASNASNEVVVAIGGAPCTAPPTAPSGLSSNVNGRIVSLSWTASGTLTNILLEVGAAPGASNLAVYRLNPSARDIVGSASPGTYYVRVRAENSCGSSGPSNELVITVP